MPAQATNHLPLPLVCQCQLHRAHANLFVLSEDMDHIQVHLSLIRTDMSQKNTVQPSMMAQTLLAK